MGLRTTEPCVDPGGCLKLLAALLVSLLLAGVATAQGIPSRSLTRGTWDFGPFVGGGLGLGHSSNTQFFDAGGRVGLVLSREHLHGRLRGNFEWAFDAMPVYPIFTTNGVVYGGSFKPVIWQWNFTSGKRLAPYVAAAGGVVFTTSNVPPGDTSTVNFTPQLVVGTRIFTRPHRAFFFEGILGHLSNASLGNQNPGYNVTLLFNVGYSWIRSRR